MWSVFDKEECAFYSREVQERLRDSEMELCTLKGIIYHCWDHVYNLNHLRFKMSGVKKIAVPTMRPNNVGRPNNAI